jgi:hypothetical protein
MPPASLLGIPRLLDDLAEAGPQGREAADFIKVSGVRVGLAAQPTGARWRLGARIELHPRFAHEPQLETYALGLIIHEVRHLQQGPVMALSVYGELEAWRSQFYFMKSRTGHYSELVDKDQIIGRLMALGRGWDRQALRAGRELMRLYAGRQYRVDLLPLYPLHHELIWLVLHKAPDSGDRRLQN